MSGHMGEIPHTSLPSAWWNFHREVSLTLFGFLSVFSLPVLDLYPQICYNNTWIILSKTTEQTRNQTVVNRTIYSSFFMPKNRKGVLKMANRIRTNRNEFHLDDKEQYILDEKFKLSGMKSKSAFLRKLILYGYVYDVDYSFLREYNTELGRISSSLNQIAKRINSTNHVYQEDMDEVKELMKQVWHTQKSMLSQQPLIKR